MCVSCQLSTLLNSPYLCRAGVTHTNIHSIPKKKKNCIAEEQGLGVIDTNQSIYTNRTIIESKKESWTKL
jgi:hypothetical protein